MATLYIRNLTNDDLEHFNRAARVRGITQREYLLKLVALHDAMRASTFAMAAIVLDQLGLAEVRA